jgi:hypothetical protein
MHLTVARILFCLLAIMLALRLNAQVSATTAEDQPAGVVFVCEHGSVKSLVAAVYFNRRAKERGLPYRAAARGVAPEATVPALVRTGLRRDGFLVSDFVPQQLTLSDAGRASLVVSFDEDVTNLVGATRYLKWDGLPGVLADYPRGREAIVARVDALVEELVRTAP